VDARGSSVLKKGNGRGDTN
jgi:hypothetical protein